jgi:hypothetical protein
VGQFPAKKINILKLRKHKKPGAGEVVDGVVVFLVVVVVVVGVVVGAKNKNHSKN